MSSLCMWWHQCSHIHLFTFFTHEFLFTCKFCVRLSLEWRVVIGIYDCYCVLVYFLAAASVSTQILHQTRSTRRPNERPRDTPAGGTAATSCRSLSTGPPTRYVAGGVVVSFVRSEEDCILRRRHPALRRVAIVGVSLLVLSFSRHSHCWSNFLTENSA